MKPVPEPQRHRTSAAEFDGVRPDIDPLPSRLWRYARLGTGYLAYIHRPLLWPAIAGKIGSKLAGRIPGPAALRRMHEEGKAWCGPRTLSTAEGLKKLGIDRLLSVADIHADVFNDASVRVNNVPVWVGGGSNIDLLYTLCVTRKPQVIVETGVANGWSSLAFLSFLDQQGSGRLFSADLPLLELRNDAWVGAAVPEHLRGSWTLLRMADRQALPRIAKQAPVFDLAYYDSDKSEAGRAFGYAFLWAHLRPGGVLVSDDIDDNMAFAHFCTQAGVDPIIVAEPGKNPQGILVKP